MTAQLAVTPLPPATGPAGRDAPIPALSRRQKAAIVVRLLLAEGVTLPLTDLPEALQGELATQMSQMRYVDRGTLRRVVEEFADALGAIGLAFPGGIEGALAILEGAISPDIAARLRQQSGMVWTDDPWDAVAEFDADRLLPLLERESPEVAAVILSKLKVAKAADLLGRLPGDRARRITFAVGETADVAPETVRRIGLSLTAALKAEPPRAFLSRPADRIGAILNLSEAATREDLLRAMEEEDSRFADEIRRTIFTFADIPARIEERDVPAILRGVDQEVLATLVAGADERSGAATEYLLENMSKRLAATLREEAGEIGAVKPRQAEEAQRAVLSQIRTLLDAKEIALRGGEDEAGG